MISRALPILIFFAALLGSGAWLAEIHPFAGVPGVEEKFTWFAAHRDDYDTLFIGSSRIFRGLDPAVFDQITAAARVPTHSFNFGIDGMFAPENAYVLEHLAKLHPKHLRWVFIESSAFRRRVGYGDGDNVRKLHWHDVTRTALICHALLMPDGPGLRVEASLPESSNSRRPFALAGTHLRLCVTRLLNAGRGARLLQSRLLPMARPHFSLVLGHARNGFIPIDLPMPARERADYQRDFADLVARTSRIAFLDRDAQCSLDQMLSSLRSVGAHPILVIPPSSFPGRPYPRPGSTAPVLDYAEIDKRPALFSIDNRIDRAHLNALGADLFTRAVAADFIELARRPDSSR